MTTHLGNSTTEPDVDATFENVPVAAYLAQFVDGDFVLRAVNKAARENNPLLTSLLGRKLTPLYVDQPWLREDVDRCMREKTTVVREAPVRRATDGFNRELRLTNVFLPPDRVMIFLQDLTPTRRTEAALVASEEHYRRIIETTSEGMWAGDLDGRTTSANEQLATMLGYSRAELLNSSIYDLVDESSRETAKNNIARRGRGVSDIVEVTFRKKDGTLLWSRVAACPVFEGGRVVGALTMIRDITAMRQAEAELHASQERLSLALRAARMGTWEWDITQKRGWWSDDMTSLYSRDDTPRDFAGFLSLVHPEDRERVAAIGAKTLDGGADVTENEYRMVRRDGEVRWVRTFGRLFTEGGTRRLIGIILDVSDEKRMEERLAQSQKLESIGRLAGGIAHDFNNLLTAILATVEYAERVPNRDRADDLATIRAAAERAAELTRQLLAFARKQRVQIRSVDLNGLITNIERLLARIVGEDVQIRSKLAEDLWPVRADNSQLEQVIVNLAANSRDALPKGGSVEIETMNLSHAEVIARRGAEVLPGDYVLLTVADDGVGMDETVRRHLFEPFFTTKNAGTGLGLASCYGIIKQLGGEIDVESEPGAGTRFRIYLPRADSKPTEARTYKPDGHDGHETILVVEDDDLVRAMTVRILKRHGYEVLSAEGPDRAMQIMEERGKSVDLLLTDVVMPRESGPKLAERVRKQRPAIRVMFVSGYPRDEASGIDPGVFLQKPFTDQSLSAKVREVLDAKPRGGH